jgi:hypothetical protein
LSARLFSGCSFWGFLICQSSLIGCRLRSLRILLILFLRLRIIFQLMSWRIRLTLSIRLILLLFFRTRISFLFFASRFSFHSRL